MIYLKTEEEIRNEIKRVYEIIAMYKKMDLEPLVLKYNGYLEALLWVLDEKVNGDVCESNNRS